MKLKCPYCKEIAEWGEASMQCPKCGKAALNRSFFRRSEKVKKEGRRRQREPGTVSPWIASGRMMGIFLIWTRIPRWIIWVGGLAVIGAFIYGPKMKADLPEIVRMAEENVSILKLALDIFREDCGRYPSEKEGLQALVARPEGLEGWRGPYITALKPDPWRHPYKYESPDGGQSMELHSLGPDGLDKTSDDIRPVTLPPGPEEPEEVPVSIFAKGGAAQAAPEPKAPQQDSVEEELRAPDGQEPAKAPAEPSSPSEPEAPQPPLPQAPSPEK